MRVAASPLTLSVLSHRLANQVEDYRRIGNRLRADADLGGQLATVVDDGARIAERLARAMAEISDFVAATARDLDAADRTLAGVVTRSGGVRSSVALASGGVAKTFSDKHWQRNRRYESARPASGTVDASAEAAGASEQPGRFNGVSFAATNRTVAAGRGETITWGAPTANVSASHFVGAAATVEASAGIGNGNLTGTVGGRVQVGMSAGVAASLGTHGLGANGRVDLFVGASTEGKASIALGRDGIAAEVGGRAFVGAEITAAGQVTVAGMTARGEAGALYGLGVEAHADVDFGWEGIGASLDLGAAIGLGGHLGFDVTVNPRELFVDFATGELTGDAVSAGLGAAHDGLDLAGDALGGGLDLAGDALGGGVKKLGGIKKLWGG